MGELEKKNNIYVEMIRQKCEDLVAVSIHTTNVEMIRQKCEDLVAVSRYKVKPV